MKTNLFNDVVNAVQRPIIHGGEFGMLMAYQQISQLGIKLCYSGHGADEFWGYQDSDYFPLLSMAFSPDMHSEHYLRQYYFRGHHESWREFLNKSIYPSFSVDQTQIEDMIWDKIFAEYRRAPFVDPYKKGRYHMMRRFLLYVNNMVDRTSMYCSVEDRSVFQNMEMVKLAFALPEFVKNRQGISQCKPFLKQAFSNLLPDNILHRPKIGFQPPRHELFREICLTILTECQPFNLQIKHEQLTNFPMNQLLFLASSQLIMNKLNEFKHRYEKRDFL
jgi:asparagine synthase (glutamine-hydrolysing)